MGMTVSKKGAEDVALPADAYTTKGGVQPKPTYYGLGWGYLTGKTGETGFGSKTTAAQVGTACMVPVQSPCCPRR